MIKSCGICVGASNLTSVEIYKEEHRLRVGKVISVPHEGNIFGCLEQALNRLLDDGYRNIAVTGRKVDSSVNLPWISEPEAVEEALKFVNTDKKRYNAVVSMGAELFVAYVLDKHGNISGVRTLNKCASGTGEFFAQQLRRMNLSLGEAEKLVSSDKVYRLSSRCSVFCKSDCTHALNKGQNVSEILAGLCEMMSRKVMELLVDMPKEKVMLIGGVALNPRVISFLKKEIHSIYVPNEAAYFEALGAALWIMEHNAVISGAKLSKDRRRSSRYTALPPLRSALPLVEFKDAWERTEYSDGDVCILGLDVGSTTTKAVIMRERDNAVLDSVYLRTNGNPVEASRNCYKALEKNLNKKIKITGLGVTGSGRQIAALHAMTDGIVNEIIAHARAAVYFDDEVDTIFEIGGQDAKYTHIKNMVACDYAMNEACSAGTGSFLEESCKETLGVELREIERYAMKGENPPNFNDQCAAFISSDIKTASYEGLKKEDIVAGLVYSICMNYSNRVKGNRIVGDKVLMQGGVCYNKAVPVAMASLLGKKIVVPPEPGLMGAFGAALEIKDKMDKGLLKRKDFELSWLIGRDVKYHDSFKCKGGAEKCDRGCSILRIEIGGRIYLFGGSCNRYYNINHSVNVDETKLNLVKMRQDKLFAPPAQGETAPEAAKTVGISRSFLTHTFFPLYCTFFSSLGMRVVVSDAISDYGVQHKRAPFCYPAEIAHGLFHNLLEKDLDYIFLPQVLELKSKKAEKSRKEQQSTCVILQSEPYYLKNTFKNFDKNNVLVPVLDFSKGLGGARKAFVEMSGKMGFSKRDAVRAYEAACGRQDDFTKGLKQYGRACLGELKKDPDRIAVVLLGRAYNTFAAEANMAIPDKFSSRGVTVMPFDSLPYEDESDDANMYWASGQMILKAARFIKKHAQLYPVFVTNFSCGPDSFIVGNVRDIMDKKPILILEIDSHTADAGINTRIEAFLDIVERSRKLDAAPSDGGEAFTPARCISYKRKLCVVASDGTRYGIDDRRVKLLLPPMGTMGPQGLAAVFKTAGINAIALQPSDGISLKHGRANTTCKECLPLILSTGSLIKYLEHREDGEILVYFMPSTGGNCRFGQYKTFFNDLITKKRIKDLAVYSMDTQNSYLGMGNSFNILLLKGTLIYDAMYDIKNALKVLAKDREAAMGIFDKQWENIVHCLGKKGAGLYEVLEAAAAALKAIPLKYPLSEATTVAIMGEIYVRRDDFCCNPLIERLAQKGIVAKTSPVLEWICYVDYLVKNKLIESNLGISGKIEFFVKTFLQRSYEKKIKGILAGSGLYHNDAIDIEKIMKAGRNFIDEQLTGESIVVVGSALNEIVEYVSGVISVGPFACLPTRIIESILNGSMNLSTKRELSDRDFPGLKEVEELPFLSIEIDGTPFPPLIEAKIEAFCLQTKRLHKKIVTSDAEKEDGYLSSLHSR
ncbi:MAG: acyl-CoA dehydratase activase [Candidatus Omnitrophota bacterium]